MDISKRLSSLAEDRGLSQYGIAKSVGMSQPYINSVFRGQRNPTIETLEKLCASLGISLAEFFVENVTPDSGEAELLAAYRALDDDRRQQLVRIARTL